MVKLTDLLDTFREQFTAKELVDFYLALPNYCKKRVHMTGAKRGRVDKTEMARFDMVGISVTAAKALLVEAGLADQDIPETAPEVHNAARGLRRALLTMEESRMGGSSFVHFVASELFPEFILKRMPNYTPDTLATARVMLFCPAMLKVKLPNGKMGEATCFRTVADVTAKFQLVFKGEPTNGFYCHRCAAERKTPPKPCRLLYVWWAEMGEAEPPLQLVLMDVGAHTIPDQQPSSAGRSAGQALEGRMTSKRVNAIKGQQQRHGTRIRVTGEQARALWKSLCEQGAGRSQGSQLPPGVPRSSNG